MTERCGWMLQCVKLVGHDGQHEVTSLRTPNPPAAAPAAEKVTPELLAAHAADLAAGRYELNGVYGCSICGTSPSEPVAPQDQRDALLRECETALLLAQRQLEQCDEGSVHVDRVLAKLAASAAREGGGEVDADAIRGPDRLPR